MPDIRTALHLDAAASGALGALLALGAPFLDGPLGLSATFLVAVGLLLLAWAGFVTWVATRPSRSIVTEVVALNAVYVVASVAFALGWTGLTGLGVAFVLVQAAAVVGLTALQLAGLRSTRSVSSAVA